MTPRRPWRWNPNCKKELSASPTRSPLLSPGCLERKRYLLIQVPRRRADGMGVLDGRVAFITGGARGQGRAHALALAAEGASVVIADAPRPMSGLTYPLGTEDDLRDTAKQVEALGSVCIPVAMDVRDPAAVDAAVEDTVNRLGSLD